MLCCNFKRVFKLNYEVYFQNNINSCNHLNFLISSIIIFFMTYLSLTSKQVVFFLFQGYCAEYNVIGALVQPHWTLECNENISCPKIYSSTDAYLCNNIFNLVHYQWFASIYFIMNYNLQRSIKV